MNPTTIGRYEILRPLGSGGMADVYLARDPALGREVALKLPKLERLTAEGLARFRGEAQAVARLEHPAIVPLYDYGDHDGRPYLVMRYMPGGSLADRIDRRGATLPDTLAVIDRIAAALDYAHTQGIVHRDVKPDNILFDAAGAAYLTDFGVARIMSLAGGQSLTGTGLAIGTVDYMSPEQALGRPNLDGRSDVYSLGVVLFEMLAGDVPYKADSALQRAMQHVSAPIPSIRERRPDLPPATQTVIEHALAKEPRDRYSTASTTAIDLRRVAGGAQPAGRGGVPVWVWAVAAVALLIITFVAIWGGRSGNREATTAAVPTTIAPVAATVAPTVLPTDAPLVAVPAAAATSTAAGAVPVTTVAPTVTPTLPTPTATPEPTLPPAPAADALPFFMTRLVTAEDVAGLSQWELDVMRNEIFARHGREFNRTDLQAHFDAQPWYTRLYDPEDFPTDRLLTDIQEANAAFILTYQQQNP